MFKRVFLILIILLASVLVFAQSVEKSTKISKDWIQAQQLNDGKTQLDNTVYVVNNPSFIVTKTIDNTKNGLLHKIWVASNTNKNNEIQTIKVTNVKILTYKDNKWVQNFSIEFIMIGKTPTIVYSFINENPNIEVRFMWNEIKIN